MSPRFQTLVELLEHRSTSTKPWLILPSDPIESDDARRMTFSEACADARLVAGALRTVGVVAGESILLVFDNGSEFCAAFLGSLLAGVVPVAVSPPFITSRLADYQDRIDAIAAKCEARFLLVSDELERVFAEDQSHRPRALTLGTLLAEGDAELSLTQKTPSPNDIAFIQLTSGSTGTPRGAELTHSNVLWNVHGIGVAVRASCDESALCWLPLHHDMGLTGLFLYTLYWGMSLVLMSPVQFISHPASWLWAMSRFKCAGSAAPNFAYALCTSPSRIRDDALAGLDLSTWRVAISGGEFVQPATLDAFVARFSKYGFRRDAFCPVYGLAENAAACCLRPFDSPLVVDQVHRDALEREDRAHPADDLIRSRGIVCVGPTISGTEVRVLAPDGCPVADRAVGEIQVRGCSRMKGFRRDAAATAAALTADGWLRTGDLGYLSSGSLHVVGRIKEIIKKAGAQYDAADMQSVVSRVLGVRPGCVAVFAVEDATTGTESIVVFAETRKDPAELDALAHEIRRAVSRTFSTTPNVIRFIPPGSLPKTSSGKVQVQECRRRYVEEALTRSEQSTPSD